jgi:predicted amidohydrolase YtcJ
MIQVPAARGTDPTPRLADCVIRAGAIYAMDTDHTVYRAVALRDAWIVAVSQDPHGLDGLIMPGTRVIDDPELTLLPALDDNHNHMILAADNLSLVQPGGARDIAALVGLIRQRATETPPGQWIRTSTEWNEANLAEKRLPNARELDQATTDHPVWVKRGGHIASANSLALRLAGVTTESQPLPGGTIERDADGSPTGVFLENPAMQLVERVIPPVAFADQVAHLGNACRVYNAHGIGAVRDPVILPDQMLVYQALQEQGGLTVRTRTLFLIPQASVTDQIAHIGGLGVRSGFGDAMLRVWGLKTFMDGGPDAAGLDQPYANNPEHTGHVFWQTDDLVSVGSYAVGRGWRIGIHAIGDRSVRTVIDAYERIIAANPGLKPGTLAIEHAFLADAGQRARAIRLGIAITIQQPLLYTLADNLTERWGRERVSQINPTAAWLREGALLSAGTDSPPTPFDPLLAIWSMVTRGTQSAGIIGPEYAIDRDAAFRLYTVGSAALNGESERRGTIAPHRLADLVAYRTDPLACAIDDLPALRPALTIVNGQAVYDPETLVRTPGESALRGGSV